MHRSAANLAVYCVSGEDTTLTLELARSRGQSQPPLLKVAMRKGQHYSWLEYATRAGLRLFPDLDPAEPYAFIYIFKDAFDQLSQLSDHALGLLDQVADNYAAPELSPAGDEIVFHIQGAAYPMLASLRPDDSLLAVSLTKLGTRTPLRLEIGNIRHAAILPMIEGSYRLPAGTFDMILESIADTNEFAITRYDLEETLLDRFWSAAAIGTDPLAPPAEFEEVRSAPMTFARGDAATLEKLVTAALALNDSSPLRRQVVERGAPPASAVVSAATPDAAFSTECRSCNAATQWIIQEIVAHCWPRGAIAGNHKTNRRSSAGFLGAERQFEAPDEVSAHELIAARATLEDMLVARKLDHAAALLDAAEREEEL